MTRGGLMHILREIITTGSSEGGSNIKHLIARMLLLV